MTSSESTGEEWSAAVISSIWFRRGVQEAIDAGGNQARIGLEGAVCSSRSHLKQMAADKAALRGRAAGLE